MWSCGQQPPADTYFAECFLCGGQFQCSHARYDGCGIPEWDIGVCDICLESNWDGIMLERHPRLVEHLKAKGISIQLNAKGWLEAEPLMRRRPR
jgi:hypothetical protein